MHEESQELTFGPGKFTIPEMKKWIEGGSHALLGSDMEEALLGALDALEESNQGIDQLLDELRLVNVRRKESEAALAVARRWARPTVVSGCVYLNSPILTVEESSVLMGGVSREQACPDCGGNEPGGCSRCNGTGRASGV